MTFSTQEVLLFRNPVSREVVIGAENRVEQCVYAAVITRIVEETSDELTGGWKVVEVRNISSFYTIVLLIPLYFCRWHVDRHEPISSVILS